VAYLNPARKRPNLTIVTHAQAERIVLEGTRAVGVAYTDRAGNKQIIKAGKEIILSGGAINSPQLLMLSGIGDAAQLKDNGIAVQKELPGVGKNMQDHLQVRLVYKCNEPTLNDEVSSMVGQAKIGLKYMMSRSGPMAMAASLATGFMRTRENLETPDIQFHVQPLSAENPGKGADKFSAFTMSVCHLRPESKGEIRLKSRDPKAYPAIIPNYLASAACGWPIARSCRKSCQATPTPLRS